jgi:hypothetical protein
MLKKEEFCFLWDAMLVKFVQGMLRSTSLTILVNRAFSKEAAKFSYNIFPDPKFHTV